MATPEPGSTSEPAADQNVEVSNELTSPLVHNVVQAGVVHGGIQLHAATEQVVPRQLPLPPTAFFGRTAELDLLDENLASPASETRARPDRHVVAISALGGAGGLGKTWLALHWAHRFPGGQLFVDLSGFSPTSEPVDPLTAIRGFLGALYRSTVVDKHMLIVLDYAATTDRVAPLIPGMATCTVLVTSRNKLAGLTLHFTVHYGRSDLPQHRGDVVPLDAVHTLETANVPVSVRLTG